MSINIQSVTDLYRKLDADYAAGTIDVEERHYGQMPLHALIVATQGEAFGRMWIEEEQRRSEEQYRNNIGHGLGGETS
jgi:hypothetical protein